MMYEEEKQRILDVIRHELDGIEHIGSTSIPGMKAKPIIDILIAVRDLGIVANMVEPLRLIGYEYRPMGREKVPDTEYFRKGPSGGNTHHIRVVRTGSQLWADYVLFRNYLRNHPEACREYEKLKSEAYSVHGRYLPLEIKRDFVKSIAAKARLELGSSSTASMARAAPCDR
jgi:GrpB-like predicted nucleotidyltransferase (UPF0157 family)